MLLRTVLSSTAEKGLEVDRQQHHIDEKAAPRTTSSKTVAVYETLTRQPASKKASQPSTSTMATPSARFGSSKGRSNLTAATAQVSASERCRATSRFCSGCVLCLRSSTFRCQLAAWCQQRQSLLWTCSRLRSGLGLLRLAAGQGHGHSQTSTIPYHTIATNSIICIICIAGFCIMMPWGGHGS